MIISMIPNVLAVIRKIRSLFLILQVLEEAIDKRNTVKDLKTKKGQQFQWNGRLI